MHFGLLAVIALCTPFSAHHPAIIWTTGATLFVIGGIRLFIALLILHKSPHNPRPWKWAFAAGTYAAAITWGTFCALTLAYYDDKPTAWFVLLVTTGIAAAASTSLSPDYGLCRNYLSILLGPPFVWSLTNVTAHGYSTPVVIAIYGSYLLIQGHEHSLQYWDRVHDHTLLTQKSGELEEQGAFHRMLITENPLPIVVLNPDRHVRMCNQAFERLFLYSQQDAEGKMLDGLIVPAELAITASSYSELVLAGKTVHATTQRKRKDGTLVDVEIQAVPISQKGKLAGLIALYQDITDRKRTEAAVQKSNEDLAVKVTELDQRSTEIRMLSETGNFLQACQTMEEAYQVIPTAGAKLFPGVSGGLFVISASRNSVESVSDWGKLLHGERVFAPEECWALRRGQLHLVQSGHAQPICAHLACVSDVEYMCIPLMAQGEALGIIHLQVNEEGAGFGKNNAPPLSEAKKQLAVAFAEQIALALANLKLRETLRNQSIRDPLTGLFNRRYLEESLDREIRRAARRNSPLCVAMADVDHFKRFNDTFGHDAGDALLRELGQFLRNSFRGEDVVCRFGGEEFALILPDAQLIGALRHAEEICSKCAQLQVRHDQTLLGVVTMSIGIAAYPANGNTAEELIKAADAALYSAKESGRNRVVTASHKMKKIAL